MESDRLIGNELNYFSAEYRFVMQTILSSAVIAVLIVSFLIILRWGNLILTGQIPARFFAFFFKFECK